MRNLLFVSLFALLNQVHSFSPPSLSKIFHLQKIFDSRCHSRLTRSSFPLHTLLCTEGGDQSEKKAEARKLAEYARKALLEAEAAERKAAALKGTTTLKKVEISRELRTRELLGVVSDITYKNWVAFAVGRPGDPDPLGLRGPAAGRAAAAGDLFRRFDLDGSGGIDREELLAGLEATVGRRPDEQTLSRMLGEADLDSDGRINADEFSQLMSALADRVDRVDAPAAAAAAAAAATPTTAVAVALESPARRRAAVEEALKGYRLVGDAVAAVEALDRLKQEGRLGLWGAEMARAVFRPTSPEKMTLVTRMKDPESELGLEVDWWSRVRYQGVGLLGTTGAAALFFSAFAADPASPVVQGLVGYGLATLAFNLVVTALGSPLDRLFQGQLLASIPDCEDRWARRQAGRFLAAYLHGLPVESVREAESAAAAAALGGPKNLREILIFSRRNGNCDLDALRAQAAASAQEADSQDNFLPGGLTKKEVDAQSVVQMTGLVAEFQRYGKATLGYRFFGALDAQLDLSRARITRADKQVQARFGVTTGFQLLEQHEAALEAAVQVLREIPPASHEDPARMEELVCRLIAAIEATTAAAL